jgi:hypothetical protein
MSKSQPSGNNGAWARFERAVDAAVKGGPKHKIPGDEKKPLSKKRGRSKKVDQK